MSGKQLAENTSKTVHVESATLSSDSRIQVRNEKMPRYCNSKLSDDVISVHPCLHVRRHTHTHARTHYHGILFVSALRFFKTGISASIRRSMLSERIYHCTSRYVVASGVLALPSSRVIAVLRSQQIR